jgi:NAD(P)H-hydrate epimerase
MGAKMADLLTSAQMRAVEAEAISTGAVTGRALMERAGAGVVAAIFEEWPALQTAPAEAVILCGPGNNGGDGFVIARHLRQMGWRVHVLLFGQTAHLPADARAMWQEWAPLGPTQGWSRAALEVLAEGRDPTRALLVVDALFGIGLSRPLGVELCADWAAFCDMVLLHTTPEQIYLCAVDVPSGVSETDPEGARLRLFDGKRFPMLTVTFHAPKLAHRAMIAAGERLRVVDIGLQGTQGEGTLGEGRA